MNAQNKKYTGTYLGIAAIAVILFGLGWFYLNMQPTTVSLESDQKDYFTVDKPVVAVKVTNTKNATSGEIRVAYSKDLLKIVEVKDSSGVTHQELNDELVFKLERDFFKQNIPTLATVQFEVISTGEASVSVNKDATKLMKEAEVIEVTNVSDAKFGVGVAPARDDRKESQPSGTYNSI